MKLFESLDATASRLEAEAAAVRQTMLVLMHAETVKAGTLAKRLKGAVALRAKVPPANGNGNNGHHQEAAPKQKIWERVVAFLNTQPRHRARLSDIAKALDKSDGAVVAAFTGKHRKLFRKLKVGIYGLKLQGHPHSANPHTPKKLKRSKMSPAARKRASIAMKKRWAERRASGNTGRLDT